jgi:hypothetical protein
LKPDDGGYANTAYRWEDTKRPFDSIKIEGLLFSPFNSPKALDAYGIGNGNFAEFMKARADR